MKHYGVLRSAIDIRMYFCSLIPSIIRCSMYIYKISIILLCFHARLAGRNLTSPLRCHPKDRYGGKLSYSRACTWFTPSDTSHVHRVPRTTPKDSNEGRTLGRLTILAMHATRATVIKHR